MSVTIELDVSQLCAHDIVAFEVLTQYKATVATHEDLKDEGITVHVEESKVSENPTTPRMLLKNGDITRLGTDVFISVLQVRTDRSPRGGDRLIGSLSYNQ